MISHDARSQRWLLSTLRRLSGTHIDDTIGPVARLRVFRGRLSIPKVIAIEIFLRCGTQAPGANRV